MSLKVDEANDKDCVEETFKKLSKKNGSVGTKIVEEMTKEGHSVPQHIKTTINGKKPPKCQE